MRIARRMRWFYMAIFEKTSSSLFVALGRRVVFEKPAKSATIPSFRSLFVISLLVKVYEDLIG